MWDGATRTRIRPIGTPTAAIGYLIVRISLSAYFAQGLAAAYFSITLVSSLREQGMGQSGIAGWFALAGSAWLLKPVWALLAGPPIDAARRHGRYCVLQGVIAGIIGMLAVLMGIAARPSVAMAYGLGLMVAANVMLAILDLVADGLALDQVADRSKERLNGYMWASRYAGFLAGGSVITPGSVGPWLPAVFAGITALYCIPWRLLLNRDSVRDKAKDKISIVLEERRRRTHGEGWRNWIWWPLCLLIIVPSALAMNFMMEEFRRSGALSAAEYAASKSSLAALAGALGALAGGFLGGKRLVIVFGLGMLGQAACWLTALFFACDTLIAQATLVGEDFFQSAWLTVVLGALMKGSAGKISATYFGLLMAAVNFSGVVGQAWYAWAPSGTSGWTWCGIALGMQMLLLGMGIIALTKPRSSPLEYTTTDDHEGICMDSLN